MKNKSGSSGKGIRKKLPRLPMAIVRILRKKGGAQGTKKGKRGYKRASHKIKKTDMNSDNEDTSVFYFFYSQLIYTYRDK